MEKVCFPVVFHGLYQTSYCNSRSISRLHSASGTSCTVVPVMNGHPRDQAKVSVSSRKVPVLGQFTMHMVEFIQLYTNQPHVWLEHGCHPSSSVFQPYIWLGYSLNDEIRRNEPHFLGHFIKIQ